MSNYLKHLDVKIYPSTSGGWDSHTSNDPSYTWSGDGTDQTPISSIPIGNKTSLNDILWPETQYTAEFTGKDAYDNTLSIANASFTTTLDYPVFNDVSACSRVSESGYDFLVEGVGEYVKDNAIAGELVTSGEEKSSLNTDFLNSNSFNAYNVIDFRDKNAFQPISFASNQFKPIESVEDPIYVNYYKDNGNNLIPGKQTLIQFSTFNRRLGIDTLQATMVWNGVTKNASAVSFPGSGSSTLGKDIPVNTAYKTHFQPETFDIDTTKNINTFSPSINPNVFNVYYAYETVSTSRPAAWIGIYTQEWSDNANDSTGTITITAKSKTKNQSGAQSTLSIPFNTYTSPQINLYTNNDGSLQPATLTNNSYYGVSNKSSLEFNGGSSGAGYVFKTQTSDVRPYVPLVNYNKSTSNNIIDSTINNFSPYSNYLFGNSYSNISIPQREIPVIVEVAAGHHQLYGWSKPFAFDTLLEAQDFVSNDTQPIGNTSISKEWKTIGAAPINDNGEGGITIIPEYHDGENEYGINSSQIINPTSGRQFDNNNHIIFSWPDNRCVLKDTVNDTNALDLLVPGKYYKFRVTTANLCGTRSNTYIFKMEDTDERFYSSKIESSNLSTPSTIGPTSSDNPASNTLSLPTSSVISIYGNECDSTTVRNNIDYNSSNYNHGWVTTNVNSLITVSYNGNVIDTWNTNDPNSISHQNYTLSNAGTYTVTVRSNSCRLINDYMNIGESYVKTHTYTINVQDGNSLDVVTNQVTNLNTTSATLNGSYTSTGSHNISDQKFKFWPGDSTAEGSGSISWKTNVTTSGTSFSFDITGLSPNTTYSYRAFATSDDTSIGDVNGEVVTFTTPDIYTPTIEINDITRTTGTIQIS